MTQRLSEVPFEGGLAGALPAQAVRGLAIWWLGQAGFVIDIGGVRLVIDPYLSDSLARKYVGSALPHQRMMAAPIEPEALTGVDAILITHAHSDHADPETLPALLGANPSAQLVAPAAAVDVIAGRAGISPHRLIGAKAGQAIDLAGLQLVPTRAAHEMLEVDDAGRHRFLGFFMRAPWLGVWHSGDCIPFDGLIEEVAALRPEVALLPVNGRSAELRARGVPGNFTLAEAIDTSVRVRASTMIAHHHGMFGFNTIDAATIDAAAREERRLELFRAKLGVLYAAALIGATDPLQTFGLHARSSSDE